MKSSLFSSFIRLLTDVNDLSLDFSFEAVAEFDKSTGFVFLFQVRCIEVYSEQNQRE